MTTIILTIIGILLAAAAALMVIFYGGDAFNSGSTGAAANTIQNAGTNVISAVQLYRVEKGNATGATMATILAANCSTGGSCLKEEPTLPETIQSSTPTHILDGGRYTITNISADVCDRINKNVKVATPPTDTSNTTLKMYCTKPATGNSMFVANA